MACYLKYAFLQVPAIYIHKTPQRYQYFIRDEIIFVYMHIAYPKDLLIC